MPQPERWFGAEEDGTRRCTIAMAHLVYGHVGSGKTTYAERLAADHNGIRFTTEDWIARLYGEDEAGVPDLDALSARVRAAMEPIWSRCLSLGVDVVLDLGFWHRAERDRARAIVQRCGADSRLYWLACSAEEAWRRVQHRNSDRNGSSIVLARSTFDRLRDRIEPLGPDEPHLVIAT